MLKDHLQYSKWASARIVEAAAALTAEELQRDFQTADKSVLGTLVHTFAADRIWLSRVAGKALDVYFDPERDMHLHVLQNDWPVLYDRWLELIAKLTPETEIDYKDMKGTPYRSSIEQIVLHLVNHATHHRGQAAGFIRAMGHTPPSLDLIRFYRERQ